MENTHVNESILSAEILEDQKKNRIDHMKYLKGMEDIGSEVLDKVVSLSLIHIFLGLSPSICAASGMVALFCGVTNCPLTSILIAFELFGFEGVSYYLIAVSISYAASGYYGLYKDQTIVYSKYKAKYVNHHTKM